MRRRTGCFGTLEDAAGMRWVSGELTVCRELTKEAFETAFRTTLSEALVYYKENPPRGECVLVLEGRSREEMEAEKQQNWLEMPLEEHMAHYEAGGMDRKEAMKQVAKDRGISKRDVYKMLLDAEEK